MKPFDQIFNRRLYLRYFKRPMDFILALGGIIVFSPVLLIIGILVKIKLGSPVIYKQERPGLNAKIFKMYKFRTMTDERDEYGDLLPDSIRLTKFGKFLRSTSLMEISDKYGIASEFTQFYKTSVVSNYRFPQIQGEKFISPEYLAREINKKYKFKVTQQDICICDYLEDGLTKNKIKVIIKNPRGYTLVKKQSFELAKGLFPKSKHAIMYIAGSILSGEKGFIKDSPNKIMTFFLYPLGWLAYKLRFANKMDSYG